MREPDWPGETRPPELLEVIEALEADRRRAILGDLEREFGFEPSDPSAILTER